MCNSAGLQHFCHIAACSAWVPVNHAGLLGSGGRTFSFGTPLASPSIRNSFVLRDDGHIKSQIGNNSDEVKRRPTSSGISRVVLELGAASQHSTGWPRGRPMSASMMPRDGVGDGRCDLLRVGCGALKPSSPDLSPAVSARCGNALIGVAFPVAGLGESGSFGHLTATANSQEKQGF